ncbi:hypothetical protein N473_26245 [Pseudoalteromonas luteoviolacea CPMOR-1]|uniref:Uncharacterized protein n=1 Tax=Pseudoalteromonas luteoviolacea CPMOR-1 TaxID=1365248 RepID=A0A167I5F1_9GAMM|nr:hypothetical protein [Pseudoalteromonas luteoviolacea]KZN58920.1 hypothetical protein N473_26245 [Pseudoalteromonas luteoviolacea CPMOR-1]
MNIELETMAQSKDERKASIAAARKAHHEAQKKEKKRIDAYVEPATKDGLKEIKACFSDVKNEGQAVDKAVELALTLIEKD